MSNKDDKTHVRLGEFSSTAIAGNDILSSSLYVSGIATLFAGVYAPFVFVLIGFVLLLYKRVYTEVVEALPLNGGAYNCLLNATSKPVAAVAGVMTILSYVATCVISAKTASEYLGTLFHQVPVIPLTALIIFAFAGLVILGVKDSAKVAMAIFTFHVLILLLLVVLGLFNILNNGAGMLPANLAATFTLFQNGAGDIVRYGQGFAAGKMLFLAFAASLLGVSGFESSANFVEEQKKGVFRKTLRNMLIGVIIFNPLIALVALHSFSLDHIAGAKDFILSDVAFHLGGNAFQYLLVFDAFFVLCGAVLTSFVGVSGLMYRMSLDNCLPARFLLPGLKTRNASSTRIIITFSLLCIAILFITGGDLLALAGVYTISFLGVMTLFALGNLILKINRAYLKRTYWAPTYVVILAGSATLLGIIGNILINPKNLVFFSYFFFPALALVLLVIYRDYVLEFLVKNTRNVPFLYNFIKPYFNDAVRQRIILFTHTPEKLFKALDYIRRNETSRKILIIYCSEGSKDTTEILSRYRTYIRTFKKARVLPQLDVEFLVEPTAEFGPEIIQRYAKRFRVSLNNVFVGSIHKSHEFSFEEMGGVRIIQ